MSLAAALRADRRLLVSETSVQSRYTRPQYKGSQIDSQSSSEILFISLTLIGNRSEKHHFLTALSLTPNILPIFVNGVVLISCFNSSLEGLLHTRRIILEHSTFSGWGGRVRTYPTHGVKARGPSY